MKNYVAKVREEKNMNPTELAKKSGVSKSHIFSIENGLKEPTVPIVCKISEALDTPCWELFPCDD